MLIKILTFSIVPKRDLFLKSLALRLRWELPWIPSCLSNADFLLPPGGSKDLLSTKLLVPFNGLSHPPLVRLLVRRRFDSRSSFFGGAFSPESEPISANFLSNSSEDFLFTCCTLLADSIKFFSLWEREWVIERKCNGWWRWVSVFVLFLFLFFLFLVMGWVYFSGKWTVRVEEGVELFE